MAKGFHGESLQEALRSIVQPGMILPFSELVTKIKERGTWKDDTIWQNLMAHARNLVPAKYHWNENQDLFLFLRPDGRYERFDPKIHPKVIE